VCKSAQLSQLATTLRHAVDLVDPIISKNSLLFVRARFYIILFMFRQHCCTRLQGVEIKGCTFAQLGGNALALSGKVHNSVVADCDFLKTGDSGVVSVGTLPDRTPNDGSDSDTIPFNVTIERCHFGQTGVFGKQTSALFIAVSKRISFLNNVLYDGPRAGVNINDGYGGGHLIQGNVIFNQLLGKPCLVLWARAHALAMRMSSRTCFVGGCRVDLAVHCRSLIHSLLHALHRTEPRD
jgi:hypothetical protein